MSLALFTGVGGLNLNDGSVYKTLDFDLGDLNVDESWIESWFTDDPILAKRAIRKSKLLIDVRVFATTMAQLITRVQAVRNEFNQNNTVSWAYDGGTAESVLTYATALPAVDVSMSGDNALTIPRDFDLARWHIEVWRKGVAVGDQGKSIVI